MTYKQTIIYIYIHNFGLLQKKLLLLQNTTMRVTTCYMYVSMIKPLYIFILIYLM